MSTRQRQNIIFLILIPVWSFGIWDADTHNVNNWRLTITNYARLGGGEDYWLPCSVPFIGGGIFLGSISPQAETLVTIGFRIGGGESEYVPGLKNQAHTSPIARIFMYPTDWPPDPDTFPMAPQTPLTYQESWSCYNDIDSALHLPGDGKPIGFEIYQTTFADTLSIIKDVVYLRYEIKNCTTYTIDDVIATICWRQSLIWNGLILHKWFHPSPSDSFLIENLGYCYDDSSAIGVLFIKTPDNLGCTANKVYPGSIMPTRDTERYLVMAGYNFQTGTYNPYDSLGFAGWAFISSGKFSLAPGETKEFVIALIGAFYIDNDTLPLAIVAKNARDFYLDSLQTNIEENMANLKPSNSILKVYPNPFREKTVIGWRMADRRKQIGEGLPSGIDHQPGVKVYDATGRLVRQWDIGTIGLSDNISWDGTDDSGHRLSAGIYFIECVADECKEIKKVILIR